MSDASPPEDWPPPGQCYFCDAPPGQHPLRTCAFHRTVEAYALALAGAFLSANNSDPKNDSDFVDPVMDWLGTDDSQSPKDLAERYWPRDLDQEDALRLNLMSISLIADLARDGRDSGLVDPAALALTPAEREDLLRDELDAVAAECRRQRRKFSVESFDRGGAFFVVKTGFMRRATERYRMELSDLGVSAVTRAPE